MSDILIHGVYSTLHNTLDRGLISLHWEGLVRLENMAWQCESIYYLFLFGWKTLEGVFLWHIMSETCWEHSKVDPSKGFTLCEEFKDGAFSCIYALVYYVYISAYTVGEGRGGILII